MVWLTAWLLGLGATAEAGVLHGVVFDEDDLEVPGTEVTLTSPEIVGGVLYGTSDAAGRFRFEDLGEGFYVVTVVHPAFRATTVSNLWVTADGVTVQDVRIQAGESEELCVVGVGSVVSRRREVVDMRWLEPSGSVETSPGAARRWTSTFAVDVDTASYTRWRASLERPGTAVTVRPEEMVNYFDYGLAEPVDRWPFAVHLEAAPHPLREGVELLRVGLQAGRVPPRERPPANLVFLVDVSGSMSGPRRLPLVQQLLSELVDRLQPRDTVAIVTYAGEDRIVLPPTGIAERDRIVGAVAGLEAGGSTAGAAGLRTAYELAERAYLPGGINRVVLATDGDFNVGLTGKRLVREVADQRDRGIFLSTFGVGWGDDSFLEQLADRGDGHYQFLDGADEVTRALDRELEGALNVVAKNAKVQVVFDPSTVRRWTLLGYDNRRLQRRDFADDAVDGGEIGSGHRVVAYYAVTRRRGAEGTLATVAVRHKAPDEDVSRRRAWSIDTTEIVPEFDAASDGFRFGVAVSLAADRIRRQGGAGWSQIRDIAADAAFDDDTNAFVDLARWRATGRRPPGR
jgi:Ca-activated chloride channel family protein